MKYLQDFAKIILQKQLQATSYTLRTISNMSEQSVKLKVKKLEPTLTNNITKISDSLSIFNYDYHNKTRLGRWNIDYCKDNISTKVNLANVDHCGSCGEYKIVEDTIIEYQIVDDTIIEISNYRISNYKK